MDNPPEPYVPPASPSPHYQFTDLPLDILDKIIPTHLYSTKQLRDKLDDVDIRFSTLYITEQKQLDDWVKDNTTPTQPVSFIKATGHYLAMKNELDKANRLKNIKNIYEKALQKRIPYEDIVEDILTYQYYVGGPPM